MLFCYQCSDLLSGSRTSRLFKGLVETGQAYHANAVPSYPGEKHPNALVLFGQPSNGVSLDTLNQAFQKEVQGLIHNGPTSKEMARIKKVGASSVTCTIISTHFMKDASNDCLKSSKLKLYMQDAALYAACMYAAGMSRPLTCHAAKLSAPSSLWHKGLHVWHNVINSLMATSCTL